MSAPVTAPTAVRLPVDLLHRYDRLAKATGRTRTYYRYPLTVKWSGLSV
ncbi:hypothetical protein QS713_04115 [Gleimia hominis]|uniref:Integrase n=1 Tax=Gleimia hominis TaxID=595468 RepID=A0ABU3IA56_9ACTO|nr:hypothetical protein [Gleimia hominis]MDT3767252.1 hypothetical protein [Gleimia hominis]